MNEMSDLWSGFVAYTYDGPTDFNMMSNGPWNGVDTLTPTKDMYNFKEQLNLAVAKSATPHHYSTKNEAAREDDSLLLLTRQCADVISELRSCCDIHLVDDGDMPSYCVTRMYLDPWYAAAATAMTVFAVVYLMFRKKRMRLWYTTTMDECVQSNGDDGRTKYGAILLS